MERLALMREEGIREREARRREREELAAAARRAKAEAKAADRRERERLRELAKQAARDKRRSRQERQAAREVASAIYHMERRDANPPAPRIRRCLNPDCLVWFAYNPVRGNSGASACSPECFEAIARLAGREHRLCGTSHLRAHARMVSKRNTMIHDRPVPTPYALRLIANIENQKANHEAGITRLEGILHAATMAAGNRARGAVASLLDGTRWRDYGRGEDGDTFNDYYLLGSEAAAVSPRTPCDHFRLRACHL